MKTGAKTSEFWLILIVIIALTLGVVEQYVPPAIGAALATAVTTLYALLRFMMKRDAERIGNQEPPAENGP